MLLGQGNKKISNQTRLNTELKYERILPTTSPFFHLFWSLFAPLCISRHSPPSDCLEQATQPFNPEKQMFAVQCEGKHFRKLGICRTKWTVRERQAFIKGVSLRTGSRGFPKIVLGKNPELGGGGVTSGNSSWGCAPGSPNPNPISDQKVSFSTPVFRPGL